ncbi:MAG: GntR family transcriptional regulator [Gemmatimonadaceae bacterium]
MPLYKLERVTSVLRDRIQDAIEMGAMNSGDRLPGTRKLAAELQVDPRLVASAFRRLQQEGLVELRPRSGVYVAKVSEDPSIQRALPRAWATEVVAQAVERGMPAHRISEAVAALTETHKVRAAVVAATSDQAVGMVRELQDDYGIAAAAVFPEQLATEKPPTVLLRAKLLVTTRDMQVVVRRLATELGKPVVVVQVRPDLFSEDWVAFMNGPVYVIVADPRFRGMLRRVMKSLPGSANVTILLAGSDEVSLVPRDARTYVTEAARRMLGREALPGRIIRPRRVFSTQTVRDVVEFLITHNTARAATD